MDATKTGPAAFGHDCTHRSRAACNHRFSTSDRIDPAVCGNVSGSLLGKQLVARKIQLAGKIKLRFKMVAAKLTSRQRRIAGLTTESSTTLRYLRGPA